MIELSAEDRRIIRDVLRRYCPPTHEAQAKQAELLYRFERYEQENR